MRTRNHRTPDDTVGCFSMSAKTANMEKHLLRFIALITRSVLGTGSRKSLDPFWMSK